jgi:hypothetical protein
MDNSPLLRARTGEVSTAICEQTTLVYEDFDFRERVGAIGRLNSAFRHAPKTGRKPPPMSHNLVGQRGGIVSDERAICEVERALSRGGRGDSSARATEQTRVGHGDCWHSLRFKMEADSGSIKVGYKLDRFG